MKRLLILLLFFSFSYSCAAQIEYCNYFKVNIQELSYEGKKGVSFNPEIVSIPGDSLSNFILQHARRFEYILYNRLDSFNKYAALFPDTSAIQNLLCVKIRTDEKLDGYFKVLSGQSETPDIYSEQEMMLIASRFFLCDKVNESDTTIGYHICVGINGQKELRSEKDYTTLEAFCIEAIFSFYQQGTPPFVANFIRCIQHSTSLHKKHFKDFQSLLDNVRSDCYIEMEKDEMLKNLLRHYYQQNKEHISIQII